MEANTWNLILGGVIGIALAAVSYLFGYWLGRKLPWKLPRKLAEIKSKRAKDRADRERGKKARYEGYVANHLEQFKALKEKGATWDINREPLYYERLFRRWQV